MHRLIKSFSSVILDFIETVVIGLSLFLVVYLFLLQPHQVNGLSMFPNFHDGDYLLTDKVSYRVGTPQRGDVIVFHAPAAANCPEDTGCDFIKRVIGVPGDTVQVKDSSLYLNQQKLDESQYLDSSVITSEGTFTSGGRVITLGPNEYFASGDNRPHSSDSRAWGPVAADEIVGRAFFRYWPAKDIGLLPKVSY
ncbi:MAG: signal peptidase I [Candidatus Pacebacteria bacterium]|nr:signal peptidase I [Candidatus Paceibacterota bacterium]PIR60404.1 MAG: signal peptidase I [Candidatus Pacebacteria bacterium CG10_big_fil_rev_8_21_14_0_10_45_6]